MTTTVPRPTTLTASVTADFTTTLSQIRVKIGDTGGDTGTGRIYLTDERISQAYLLYPSIVAAAVECTKQILAELAKDVDKSGSGISSNTSQVTDHYEKVLARLEAELAAAAIPYIGGVSASESETDTSDTNFVQPAFSVGMHSR